MNKDYENPLCSLRPSPISPFQKIIWLQKHVSRSASCKIIETMCPMCSPDSFFMMYGPPH